MLLTDSSPWFDHSIIVNWIRIIILIIPSFFSIEDIVCGYIGEKEEKQTCTPEEEEEIKRRLKSLVHL